eukprot:TRINITY_DN29247_c0_g1_i2.p1 TRINITY_DN29247_c0_g1~~TRINITY_DN29247_c0_g1_i2.p1  ORF type:complete len:213 (-),score=39.52 TRINITY_DN29247_c0_g1_i2:73-711(-)
MAARLAGASKDAARPRPQSGPSSARTEETRSSSKQGTSSEERPSEYLARLGCASNISGLSPELSLGVAGHCEEDGHTMYEISCALRPAEQKFSPTVWSCKRRLCHLREGLHDKVKDSLGEAYAAHFADAPFARRGGMPGTTARLGTWLGVLARCLSTGVLPADCCAQVLRFLDAPIPEGGRGDSWPMAAPSSPARPAVAASTRDAAESSVRA